jgi:hypothetical protein
MSATCDPLVRGQTSAGQSPARICVAYNIALGTLVRPEYVHQHGGYRLAEIFPSIRFEGAERVQQIFKAVDNSRAPRPVLHTAAQS